MILADRHDQDRWQHWLRPPANEVASALGVRLRQNVSERRAERPREEESDQEEQHAPSWVERADESEAVRLWPSHRDPCRDSHEIQPGRDTI